MRKNQGGWRMIALWAAAWACAPVMGVAQEPAPEVIAAPEAAPTAPAAGADWALDRPAVWMPAECDVYLEVADCARLVEWLPIVLTGERSPEFDRRLRFLAGRRVAVGMNLATQRFMVVLEAPDDRLLGPLAEIAEQSLRDFLAEAAPDAPTPPRVLRDPRWRVNGNLAYARFGRRWIATNDRAFVDLPSAPAPPNGVELPALIEPPSAGRLIHQPSFLAAAAGVHSDAEAWLYMRPGAWEPIANDVDRQAAQGDASAPLNKLWTGVLAPLARAPYLALELRDGVDQRELTLVLPEELRDDDDGDLRLLVNALEHNALADKPLLPAGTILSVSAAVSHDALELASRILLDPERLKELSKTSPDAAALLEGLPLLRQILGELSPQTQLVIARHAVEESSEDSSAPRPDLPLPSFALILRPRDAGRVKTAFITSYLGAIRNANTQAKKEGRPTFTLKSERHGDALVTGAVYPPSAIDDGRVEYNLSPAMAIVGDRFIISSTMPLAEELVDLAQRQSQAEVEETNLRVDLGPGDLFAALGDALPGLVAPSGSGALARRTRPAVDLARIILRQLAERLPSETSEVAPLRSRVPMRIRLRARFNRL